MGTFCNWRARLSMFKILQCRMPKTKRALPTLSKHRSGANLSRETLLASTRRLIVVNSMQHWVFLIEKLQKPNIWLGSSNILVGQKRLSSFVEEVSARGNDRSSLVPLVWPDLPADEGCHIMEERYCIKLQYRQGPGCDWPFATNTFVVLINIYFRMVLALSFNSMLMHVKRCPRWLPDPMTGSPSANI